MCTAGGGIGKGPSPHALRWRRCTAGASASCTMWVISAPSRLSLAMRAPAKASQIAREVGVTPAGATDVIDRLEERRLVRRVADPTDRRAVLVSLAALGLRRHRETRAAVRSMLDEVDRAMTPAERRALALGMAALLRALPRKRA